MTHPDLQRATGAAAPALDVVTPHRVRRQRHRDHPGRLLSGMGRGRGLLAAAALGLICYGLYFVL